MYEYLRPAWEKVTYGNNADTSSPTVDGHEAQRRLAPGEDGAPPPIARTAKLYIGGSQVRPDQGYSLDVDGAAGTVVGQAAPGSRKAPRHAGEGGHAARRW